MTKNNTPTLRFDGFDGEWEMKEFGSVVTRSSTASAEPALPRLEYEDIVSGVGVLNKDLSRKESLKAGLLFGPGDVLYGKLRPYLKNWLLPDFHGIAVGDFWVLRSLTADPKFLYQLIQTPMYDAVASISSGSKMPRADWKLVSRASMVFPSTIEEQRAIGELFCDLDALIEQHRAKHANLRQTKTALLQRMFPQDGANKPELRIGGFSNPWVLRHLGEFEITTGPFGSTLHAEDYVAHGTPIVTTEHFKSGLLPLTGQGVPQVSVHDRHRLKSYWLQTNDIVFSRVGSVDINARVTELQNGWLFSGRVLRVRPDATCESEFLHSVLETDSVRDSIRKRAVGMSMPSINTAILANTSFCQPPTLEEQRAIGEVFSNLDALIAAEASYITQLTQAKTALLQRMFV